ncbi:hybrid sensor histidine kinase/response regulator [Pseudobacter ginsenosidimutans]|jgi:signal transduction histidine kinase|uniref:histidine kinase n=1 Tax=Pseudobacter ginsenosidimutans TaxID=661488 RepID=A0A4Q7N5F3_9BACT|nr:response regulator [Pseudobacter ginsenosidimutans]QEC44774.1 response regulator [Pseudobacter ginsenosidimutans]RZS76259.1 phospho-acceptor domain-containing protein [Pseudobacter ginsenosidimutans]
MILIVDDRPENIFSLKKLLELNQFTVDSASSGEDALRKILKNTYFLIILDVQMPGMDGFEVAEAVTGYSKSRDIPIIFLSAVNTEKRFIARGYSSGAIDYVTKPFDPDILLLKVKNFYRLHQQTRELNEIQKTLRDEIEVRKQAQAQLHESVEEMRSTLESIPQIAFTSDANGNIEFVNRYWYQFSFGMDMFPQTPPGTPTIADYIQRAVSSGIQSITEIQIRPLKSEEYRVHLFTMTPVKKDDRITKWVGICTDIHEQKMVNQVLEQRVQERTQELMLSNQELEASNHELQQFAYVASHDLKEPLRKIQVFSHLVKQKFLADNPDAINYMDRLINSSDRMIMLITDVLKYSKLSISADFVPTDINEILLEIIEDSELLIQEKQADIEVDPIPALEVIPAQIRQVFQNIISNALKFSSKTAQPTIRISAEPVKGRDAGSPADPAGNYCRITVTDNGIGFNEIFADKIFAIFQRLHSREEYEGTGIGLAIVKKIIETHNGIVTAKSEEGKGSSFIVVLPVKQTFSDNKVQNNGQ